MSVRILIGDALAQVAGLPDESVQCCVTSPPYYGLRDYGTATWQGGDPGCDHAVGRFTSPASDKQRSNAGSGQMQARDQCPKCGATRKDDGIGLEPTPEAHIDALVEVFREVRRALRKDGVLWLNYGDAYASAGEKRDGGHGYVDGSKTKLDAAKGMKMSGAVRWNAKPKDLLMLPARVALALQADGWWLRSMLPWVKRSAMPESADDRPATAIEYMFMFTKSGDTLYWQHRDGGATRNKPLPDYVWRDRCDNDAETRMEPPNWRDEKAIIQGVKQKRWRRVNLWRGRDYFWDGEAVRAACQSGPSDIRKMQESRERIGGKHKVLDDPFSKASAATNIGQKRSVGDPSGRNCRNSDLFYASLEPPHGLISGPDGEPLALDVNPAGFAEAHFATFPPKLIEPLIKAATSEKGCCADCAAPWVREVERGELVPDESQKTLPKQVGENGRETRDIGWNREEGFAPNVLRPTKTLGWSPSCGCKPELDGGSPQPCTILDCFGGAGTTGLVADRLGRNAILIELNPEYAEMARGRISGDSPLFAEVEA